MHVCVVMTYLPTENTSTLRFKLEVHGVSLTWWSNKQVGGLYGLSLQPEVGYTSEEPLGLISLSAVYWICDLLGVLPQWIVTFTGWCIQHNSYLSQLVINRVQVCREGWFEEENPLQKLYHL